MLPFSITRGPRKADILLDSTCFSTADFDNFSDSDADSDNYDPHSRLFNFFPTMTEIQNSQAQTDTQRKQFPCNNALDNRARYMHPTLPLPSLFSTLSQPHRFVDYIKNMFPSIKPNNQSFSLTESTIKDSIYKDVNATAANTLLSYGIPSIIAESDWIKDFVFSDSRLPEPFDPNCLDDIPDCWDATQHKFVNFPASTLEHTIQDWLNHLAHVLGVKHGLIKPASLEEPSPEELLPEELSSAPEELLPAPEELSRLPEEFMSECMYASGGEQEVDIGSNHGAEIGDGGAGIEVGEVVPDNVGEQRGYVVAKAEDRSFSMISHKNPPTGGYRTRKPDIILLNRNLRHFLHKHNYRPRWHQIEAVVEVSSSASRADMVRQIFEKTAIMFEAQPFRQFAMGLAFRGTSTKKVEYCFLLIDRAGACITEWTGISGFSGIKLARIIYALSYSKADVLGVDPSMTINPVSGDVTYIKVKGEEYFVVKHIHSSLVLFGHGTHVFIVKGANGLLHILKDSWVLVGHGLCETDVLDKIQTVVSEDSSEKAKKFQPVYTWFIAGEDIGESTRTRRGFMADQPPERVHRRVVNGPVGDPLTSYRSREEFVKVLLDCVEWLEYLHEECKIVHGDLSVNNIIIFREPLPNLPAKPVMSKGTTTSTSIKTTARVTRSVTQRAQAPIAPAPIVSTPPTGVNETIPVVGVVIDYDYARGLKTKMDRTSGTLPFMPLTALDITERGNFTHSPANDLESLLQTALAIVCFTAGPCGKLRPAGDHVPMARWFNETDREQLFKDKTFDLMVYKREIEAYIPEYWQPFTPYLRRLVSLTWPDIDSIGVSFATHEGYKVILKEALEDLKKCQEILTNYAISNSITQKRARPSKADAGRYPYPLKYTRGNDASERIPRFIAITQLSAWQDSVNA